MSDGPSSPRVLSVRAAAPLEAKSAQGPTVSSAHPSFGDQGTTLDVQIFGSGFTSGATVAWLLNGVADGRVHTNSAQTKSSSEIDANITITSDATLAFRDVQVSLIGGKNGVGSDAFEVTSAQILGPGTVGSSATVLGANDQGQVVGSAAVSSATHAWVYDRSNGMLDLGGGEAHGIDALGAFIVGTNAQSIPTAWVQQANHTWTSQAMPLPAGSFGGTASATIRATEGSAIAVGWDVYATHVKEQNPTRAEAWHRALDGTWSSPQIYSTPAGYTSAAARHVDTQGEVVGVLQNYHGIVWESPTTYTILDGNPVGINPAGTLIVGQNATFAPVYWSRDPATHAWRAAGTPLPSVAGASCPDGFGLAVNDAGVIVGWSCTPLGKLPTVWRLDLSGPTPVLVGAPTQLPTLGVRNSVYVQVARTVTNVLPFVATGTTAISSSNEVAVRWNLP
jgi:hypothetical protein